MSIPAPLRFQRSFLVDPCGCWLWQRTMTSNGYGRFFVMGRYVSAHVWSYTQYVGEIPEGLQLDHLCRNKACVNPAHLEPVTASENRRRAEAVKTLCPSGHPYSGINNRGHRICHTCGAAAGRKCWAKGRVP